MRINRLLSGIEILSKYDKMHTFEVEGQHDIILFDPKLTLTDVSEDDKAALDKLGFFFSEEFGCWAAFT